MIKTATLIVALFVLALTGGFLLGRGMARSDEHRHEHSWLGEELQLTPAQQEQMRTIWSEIVRSGGPRGSDRRRQLQRERDEQIVSLLTPEQKLDYDEIMENYNFEVAEANKEREANFQKAVEATRAILNDKQRAKYDDLMKKGGHGGPPWGGHSGGMGMPGGRPPGPPDGPPPATEPGRN